MLLEAMYAPVRGAMADVEKALARELRSQYRCVDAMVEHGWRLGGKRLRPALLLLTAQAVGRLTREHITLATVLEMIHTATLVHDDVLDGADTRRHLPTHNARWGNQSSVLFGDYLFTHAFYLASTLGSTEACRSIGRSTNRVCEGELRQIDSSGNFDLTEEQYLSIIEAKTAELCDCCCRLGARHAGGSEEQVEALAGYGLALGIAFQIADDLLDVLGDERQTGKSLGTDLAQQKLTLPLIRLRDTISAAERPQLLSAFSRPVEQRHDAIADLLARSDAIAYTRETAERYAEQARELLRCVPESDARTVLEQITYFVVHRPA
ncbi:MAG: polyprenyl synthetase family protein [Planctomycetales bacterium]|nr:polyprenyl synthetase family protein [Planctomycetales bacterium]